MNRDRYNLQNLFSNNSDYNIVQAIHVLNLYWINCAHRIIVKIRRTPLESFAKFVCMVF